MAKNKGYSTDSLNLSSLNLVMYLICLFCIIPNVCSKVKMQGRRASTSLPHVKVRPCFCFRQASLPTLHVG